MNKQQNSSIWGKGLNWIANYTYRQIPALINNYQSKVAQPRQLCFQDYILSPQLARDAGLMSVRQMRRDCIKRREEIQRIAIQFKSGQNETKQKPHEFMCPICLELMNGPVTTNCSHTFCHMCIDEAILFSPSCPVCRNGIRADELIVSKSLQKIILTLLYKFEIEQVEKYVNRQLEYQEWIQRRTVKRELINAGDFIDARDTEFIWCKATVVAILPTNCVNKDEREALLVHYEGWASVFDEVISLESHRLANSDFYLSREEIPHYNLNGNNTAHLRSAVITGPASVPELPQVILDSESEQSQVDLFFQSQSQQNSIPTVSDEILDQNEELDVNQSQLSSDEQQPEMDIIWQPQVASFGNSYFQLEPLQNLSIYAISLPPLQMPTSPILFPSQDQAMEDLELIDWHTSINPNHSLPEIRRLNELKNSQFNQRIHRKINQDPCLQSSESDNSYQINLVEPIELYNAQERQIGSNEEIITIGQIEVQDQTQSQNSYIDYEHQLYGAQLMTENKNRQIMVDERDLQKWIKNISRVGMKDMRSEMNPQKIKSECRLPLKRFSQMVETKQIYSIQFVREVRGHEQFIEQSETEISDSQVQTL